jgi:hypothetical protein
MQGYGQPGGTSPQEYNQSWGDQVPISPGAAVQPQGSYQSYGGQPTPPQPVYSQPTQQPVPQPPPKQPKKGKWLFILGIIIVIVSIIGALLSLVLYSEASNAKSMLELIDDYDVKDLDFKSYDDGDEVVVKGEITEEQEAYGLYSYQLDNAEFWINSNKELGDVGDEVVLTCEIQKESLFGVQMEYLWAKSKMSGDEGSGPICLGVSIVGLILGIVITLIGYKKGKRAPTQYSPPQNQVLQPQYGGQQQSTQYGTPTQQQQPPQYRNPPQY